MALKNVHQIGLEDFEKNIPSSWEIANFEELTDVTDYVANGSFASLKENVRYLDNKDYAVLVRLKDYTNN